ncbi:hypothetical protein [Limnoglobus roseus]|uniref:Uncharacterized protein n=1 Tax=Limnoglobus roseus TaxID=2598579 RepID=A0A5C1ARF0_9BACT|nr:hypothetical protein [Limnoglobus roseus]QEL20633.1 hypothetical protein PX52LOC_07739 [Limnoglobus roseus]
MSEANVLTVECDVHVDRRGRGARKEVLPGPDPRRGQPAGRVPRVARWMALAIRCDELLRDGVVDRYADLAELGQVSRPRVTQIMNLLGLAPDIQEAVLFLPRTTVGRDPILLRELQPIAATLDWGRQRKMWRALNRHHDRT